MADITPDIPEGRQLIQGYGAGGFRIAGQRYEGSVIILPTRTLPWTVENFVDVLPENLGPIYEAADRIEVLLIGCGTRMAPPSVLIREAMQPLGIVPEFMDTGAACRTFNVLLSEDRAVAAALLAVE